MSLDSDVEILHTYLLNWKIDTQVFEKFINLNTYTSENSLGLKKMKAQH